MLLLATTSIKLNMTRVSDEHKNVSLHDPLNEWSLAEAATEGDDNPPRMPCGII